MIYDVTQIFNELDLLEIRLNILDPHVDKFVIGQSKQTFSGKEKSLYFDIKDERWAKWKDKIIEVLIPVIEPDDVFIRTAFQKDYLRTALKDCKPDDVIYYGDVDEIWRPKDVEGKLQQLNYCYYLNQRSSEDWQGTNRVLYKNLTNLNELRADHSNVLLNGGWHFTNQGGIDQIRKKIDAYDHQEMITDDVRANLEQRMLNGEDYLGRSRDWQGFPFEFWTSEVDLPEYIIKNKEKYIKLWK
jgi:hypothetical protein